MRVTGIRRSHRSSKVAKARSGVAKPKYIAPRLPVSVSSGGEGASGSSFTPSGYVSVSSGGEGGGSVYVPVTSSVSGGGE